MMEQESERQYPGVQPHPSTRSTSACYAQEAKEHMGGGFVKKEIDEKGECAYLGKLVNGDYKSSIV